MVPGVPSRWIGLTTPSKGILPGHQGRTPPRPARCSRLRGRLTRATTDLHREARPARAASGASTLHQPLRPLRAGLPLGPSPHDAAPTPSLSQWRSELRRPDGGREGLASFVGARIARNAGDQWLAAHGPAITRHDARESICIALFRACQPTGDGPSTPQRSILPGHQRRMPPRIARRSTSRTKRRSGRRIHIGRHDQHGSLQAPRLRLHLLDAPGGGLLPTDRRMTGKQLHLSLIKDQS